ncbi:MAG: hypothetical protein ACU0GG_19320 [Paracoccaceae bacterium]
MRQLNYVAIALLLSTTGALQAQELEFASITAQRANISSGDQDTDISVLNTDIGLSFGALSVTGEFAQTEIFGDPVRGRALTLGYDLTSDWSLLASYNVLEVAGREVTFSELGGTYDRGRLWTTLTLGTAEFQDEVTVVRGTLGYGISAQTEAALSVVADIETGGIAVAYADLQHAGERLDLAGRVQSLDGSTIVGVDLSYAILPKFDVLFEAEHQNGQSGFNITNYAVGAAYHVTPDVNLFAKVGRAEISSDFASLDFDTISFGVTYDFGRRSLRERGPFDLLLEERFLQETSGLGFF